MSYRNVPRGPCRWGGTVCNAPEIGSSRVIVAHLGSGASLCALKERKSIDSGLSFTALDGLCMGTRPGAVDPGVILYLFQNLGLSADEVEAILYKKFGLLGISGVSNDMRVLLESREPSAKLAVDYFVYRALPLPHCASPSMGARSHVASEASVRRGRSSKPTRESRQQKALTGGNTDEHVYCVLLCVLDCVVRQCRNRTGY
jgi:acetate kinase